MKIGLHEAVRAPNLFAIFELHCPATGTFFTPIGELGLALHEIWEISNLPMDSMSYEEYFSCVMELEQMEKDDPEMFETYQELMCHFYISMDVHNTHENANTIKVLVDYLFSILDGAPKDVQFSIPEDDIRQKMISSAHEDIILEEEDGFTRRVTGSRAFTIRRSTLCLEKLSSLASCRSG